MLASAASNPSWSAYLFSSFQLCMAPFIVGIGRVHLAIFNNSRVRRLARDLARVTISLTSGAEGKRE